MKWTAFLRLTGETRAKKREELPGEFAGLVKYLRSIDIEYNLVVLVEGEGSRAVHPLNSEEDLKAWARGERDI